MERYASKPDTLNALKSMSEPDFLVGLEASIDDDDIDGTIEVTADQRVDVYYVSIYKCGLGYWCVMVDGCVWGAPIVWNGPRADYDTETNEQIAARFKDLLIRVAS